MSILHLNKKLCILFMLCSSSEKKIIIVHVTKFGNRLSVFGVCSVYIFLRTTDPFHDIAQNLANLDLCAEIHAYAMDMKYECRNYVHHNKKK